MYERNGYYYRSRREGETVVTEYVGRSANIVALGEQEAREREQRAQEAAAVKAEQEAELALDREIDELERMTRRLVQAQLLASGYHTHKRQWRKRRDHE